MKAKVMPDGRISLPAGLRKKHGLIQGGDVIVEDAATRSCCRPSTRSSPGPRPSAASWSRAGLVASVDDFLADRSCEAEAE